LLVASDRDLASSCREFLDLSSVAVRSLIS